MDMNAFCEFINGFNAVKVDTVEEFDAVIKLCRECGFRIGFDVGSWRSKDMYIRLGDKTPTSREQIHTGKTFRGEKYSIRYCELEAFLQSIYGGDDLDDVDLPDVTELLF